MSLHSLALALPLVLGLASAECYSGVNIFQSRGTGEAMLGSLSDVAANATVAAIPGSVLTRVEYPANSSFLASVNQGVQMLQDMTTQYVRQCPDSKIALLGYSQGASVTGYALTGANATSGTNSSTNSTMGSRYVNGFQFTALGEDVTTNIVAIVLYGDPGYEAGQSYDVGQCQNSSAVVRTGAQRDTFNEYGGRIASYCNTQDPVCCGGGNDITQHVSYFTQQNGQDVADFVKQQFDSASGPDGSPNNGTTTGGASPSTSTTPSSTSASSGGASSTPATSSSTGGAGGPSNTAAPPTSSTAGAPAPSDTNAAGRMSASVYGGALSVVLGVCVFLL